MLGKLIKNEFKTTWQSMSGVFLAAGITAIVMLVFIVLKIKAITIIGSIALIAISLVSVLMVIIMVIQNYYRSMFGTQGYLTFTLPVKSSSLLFSKTIVSFSWIFISFALIAAVLVFLVLYLAAQASSSLKGFASSIYQLLQEFQAIPDINTVKFILIMLAIAGFVALLAFVCRVYFAMTLAHTKMFQKISAPLASIIVYAVIFVVSNIVNTLCAQYVPLAIVVSGNNIYLTLTRSMLEQVAEMSTSYIPIPIGGFVFSIVLAFVLYFVTNYLIKNKVNIK